LDGKEIAESFPIWIASGISVCTVLLQAVIFAGSAYRNGIRIGLTKEQMKSSVKASAIISIGPSLVILSAMLSLLAAIGAPIAWERLSVVGSIIYESAIASIGAASVGIQLGEDTLTPEALTIALWTAILCSIEWTIFGIYVANRMGRIQRKILRNNSLKSAAISTAALIGVFSSFSAQNIVKSNKNTLAWVLGSIIMISLMKVSDWWNLKWLKNWSMVMAIFTAAVIASIV